MVLFLFGISMGEVVLIFLIVLMLFGSKKIPELARSLGKGINEFRRAADDIKREFEEGTEEIRKDLYNLESEVQKEGREVGKLANDLTKDEEETDATDYYGLDTPEISAEDLPKDDQAENNDDNEKGNAKPE